MMGMPKFHETKELGEFESYMEAIDKVESSLLKGVFDVQKSIPSKCLVKS